MKLLGVLVLFFFSFVARADFPENDLYLEDGMFFNANMTEARFKQIIDSVVNIYRPIVEAKGKKLVVEYNWNDSTVNAYASQQGNTWRVAMFGGLARRPEITDDGFAMVVCHELGHHLGGYAFYSGGNWAATEGQSDYFANQACAKKVFKTSETVLRLTEYRAKVSKRAQDRCDSVYSSQLDRAACYRSLAGGQSLANLLARLNGEGAPKFETPDQDQVSRTYEAHPVAQCRLDTYLAGAVCTKAFRDDLIPGRFNPKGQESFEAQTEAFTYSCSGTSFGARPRCWFAPKAGR